MKKFFYLHKEMDDLFLKQSKKLGLNFTKDNESFMKLMRRYYPDIVCIYITDDILTYSSVNDVDIYDEQISFAHFLETKPVLTLNYIKEKLKTENVILKYPNGIDTFTILNYDERNNIFYVKSSLSFGESQLMDRVKGLTF